MAALAHHFPHGGVGHQFAAAHVLHGRLHGRGLIAVGALAGGAKNVSGGKMAGAETLGEEFGLRAFAHAGGSQEDEAPGVLAFGRNGRALASTAPSAEGPCSHSMRSFLMGAFILGVYAEAGRAQ